MTTPLLDVAGLHVEYDGVEILHGIDFTVDENDCVGIIGPNGCGKSTLMHAIAGLKQVSSGRVRYRGLDVTSASARQRLLLGFGIVPQGRRVFQQMTVEENLLMGGYLRKREARSRLAAVLPLLGKFASLLSVPCGSLSSGGQQLVAIARALMLEPRILLLDEPLLGLAASNRTLILNTIRDLISAGSTILIVEHRIDALNTVANRTIVLQAGRIADMECVRASIAPQTEAWDFERRR